MRRLIGFLLAALGAGASIGAAPTATLPAPDWRATVRELAMSHFKNPAWGYAHCLRDYALARELAAADHVALDDDGLYAASYLHDMAAFPPWEDVKGDHSDVGARVGDSGLQGTGIPTGKMEGGPGGIRTRRLQFFPWGRGVLQDRTHPAGARTPAETRKK